MDGVYVMNTYTTDSFLEKSLASLAGLTEIRDSRGEVLGYFSPASRESAEAYARAAAHFDRIELNARKLSGEIGRTTSEVLKRITDRES